jgi:hypothetical protein
MEKLNQNNRDADRTKEDAYLRAKKRVDSVRGFYIHLAIYILMNLFITSRRIYEFMEDGFSFVNSLSQEDVYTLWIVWGIGLAIHGINVFSSSSLYGQNWEERKIREYMNEDARNSK